MGFLAVVIGLAFISLYAVFQSREWRETQAIFARIEAARSRAEQASVSPRFPVSLAGVGGDG